MGAPIKHRKKYVSHKKRWDKNTIDEERILVEDYALKNKKEIRKIELKLSKYKGIAKEFNKDEASKKSDEAKKFIAKLKALGFLNQSATSLDEVLDIQLRDIFERRLGNLLYTKKLARTQSQARQFIVHKHVKVGDKVIDSPSYLVPLSDEELISFVDRSTLSNEEHPERKIFVEEIEVIKNVEETPNVEETNKASSFDENEKFRDDEEAKEK